MEIGLEILARLTKEQFEKLKEDKLATYKTQSAGEGYPQERLVKIKSGVFVGMQGTLINTNEKKDEWRVRIELFENPTEVVFSREEIEDVG